MFIFNIKRKCTDLFDDTYSKNKTDLQQIIIKTRVFLQLKNMIFFEDFRGGHHCNEL